MKKIKKLSKGMTLVEVIVSMTIFALAAACIMSVIGGAMKISNRSRKRDLETAQQANAVEKKSDTELTKTGDGYEIVFVPTGGVSKTVSGIDTYAADAAQFGADFGFQIKTFNSGGLNSLSTSDPVLSVDSNEFKLTFINKSAENVTAYVTIEDGFIYEGNSSNGYIHTSKSYVRTAEKYNASGVTNSTIDFGYYNLDSFNNGDVKIRFVTASNVVYGDILLSSTDFTDNKWTITYDPSAPIPWSY